MEVEINYYKITGKWYSKEIIEIESLNKIQEDLTYSTMDCTVHIIESDGNLQPYRMFKR